ncbi:MAG: pyridoxamine 5'-phosphate oxidase family protein [Bacteroidetes bacterium]|nr:pyridoxamine 5'-phosphate oxidase family protein [Bacteroidota bacterium]
MMGKLSDMEIEEVLKTQFVGRIGCCAGNESYVVPISYAYDGHYIYGRTKEGKKIDMMRRNPSVCFEVDEMKDMANWRSVITQGLFEELTDRPKRNEALHILVERILPLVSSETTHLTKLWPFPDDDVDGIKGVVFRIRLTEKTGRFENNAVTEFFAS